MDTNTNIQQQVKDGDGKVPSKGGEEGQQVEVAVAATDSDRSTSSGAGGW